MPGLSNLSSTLTSLIFSFAFCLFLHTVWLSTLFGLPIYAIFYKFESTFFYIYFQLVSILGSLGLKTSGTNKRPIH